MCISMAEITEFSNTSTEQLVADVAKQLQTNPFTVSPFKSHDGRRVAMSRKRYQLSELNPIQHEIIRMLAGGMKPAVVAARLGIHPQTVSNVKNTILARAKLQVLHAERDAVFIEQARRINQMAAQAVDLMQVLLAQGDSLAMSDPTAANKLAMDVMKLAGYPTVAGGKAASTAVTVNAVGGNAQVNVVTHATAQDLAEVRMRLAKAEKAGVTLPEENTEPVYTEEDLVSHAGSDDFVLTPELCEILKQDGFMVDREDVVDDVAVDIIDESVDSDSTRPTHSA